MSEDFTLISDSWSYTTDLNAQNGITGFQECKDSTGATRRLSANRNQKAGLLVLFWQEC
jgi:hypothetical protein